MGTITKRTGARGTSYQAKVRRAGHPILSKSFPDRRTAELWIAQQELSVARGDLPDSTASRGTTMLALMQRYLREVTPAKKGAVQEGYHMRPLMRSKIAAYTLATLTPQAVREWRDERLRTACGTTVNRQLNLLHHVIEYARKEWGIGNGNAVSDVKHSVTGFTGRTVNSVRAEMAQMGRNDSALVGIGPATFSPSGAPTSKQFIQHQQVQQARADTAIWYDHSSAAPVVAANVHSDYDPTGYLAAHGFRAVNGKGEEVALTPRQARGLVGRYMDSLNRGGNESVSFRDDSLPPARATVYLSRRR